MFISCVLRTDIDECTEGTHQCDHNCSNNVGSYTCSCRTGYRLAADGRSCVGKKTPQHLLRCYVCYSDIMNKLTRNYYREKSDHLKRNFVIKVGVVEGLHGLYSNYCSMVTVTYCTVWTFATNAGPSIIKVNIKCSYEKHYPCYFHWKQSPPTTLPSILLFPMETVPAHYITLVCKDWEN